MAEQEEEVAQEQEMYGEDLEEVYEDEIPVDGEAAAQGEDGDELAAMKQKLAEMEAEAAKLRQLQGGGSADGAAAAEAAASKEEADSRSIYVGNVDYACTPEELQNHFQSCGTVNRVTILTDKFGSPKGYAYIEFMEVDAVSNALLLDNSEVRGRQIKVSQKRTNVPGLKVRGRGRGRGGFGFGGRGGFPGYGAPYMPYGMPYGYGMAPPPFMGGRGRGAPGFAPRGRGRGGGGRGGFFQPY